MKTKLLEEAQHLSITERIELVEAIWDSVAEDASGAAMPLSETHRDELDRRLADLKANPDLGSTWAEVRERLERNR